MIYYYATTRLMLLLNTTEHGVCQRKAASNGIRLLSLGRDIVRLLLLSMLDANTTLHK